jgi:hypothetical protein
MYVCNALLEILVGFAVWWHTGTVQRFCHLDRATIIVVFCDMKSVSVPCSAMLFLVIHKNKIFSNRFAKFTEIEFCKCWTSYKYGKLGYPQAMHPFIEWHI